MPGVATCRRAGRPNTRHDVRSGRRRREDQAHAFTGHIAQRLQRSTEAHPPVGQEQHIVRKLFQLAQHVG
jgi:hypothetical protein